jgi:hypothetical protein
MDKLFKIGKERTDYDESKLFAIGKGSRYYLKA